MHLYQLWQEHVSHETDFEYQNSVDAAFNLPPAQIIIQDGDNHYGKGIESALLED